MQRAEAARAAKRGTMGKKTALYGAIGAVLSVAMLGFGYWAGNNNNGGRTENGAGTGQETAAEGAAQTGAAQTGAALPAASPEFDAAIRDYLLRNPEVLVEAQETLQRKEEEKQRASAKAAITRDSAKIFNAKTDAVVANPQAEITMVEFFDYNCGYCKRALDDMNKLIAENKDIRFVLKGFPILGQDSHGAHVVSEAFKKIAPEKYLDFHRKLMGGQGRADEARAVAVALELGVDEAALRKTMKDPAIEEAFRETYQLANDLGITGTPSYVVADEVVFGAVGMETLAEKVANAKTCGSTVC